VSVAFISFTAVRIIGAALLSVGVLAIANSHRLRRGSVGIAGIGALGATLGLVSLYHSFGSITEGPGAGWQQFRQIFTSTFDSWLWVGVFAAVVSAIWLGVALAVSRRWSSLRAAAIVVGSVVGAVTLGLLDRSL
jgi:hypothetical protein